MRYLIIRDTCTCADLEGGQDSNQDSNFFNLQYEIIKKNMPPPPEKFSWFAHACTCIKVKYKVIGGLDLQIA